MVSVVIQLYLWGIDMSNSVFIETNFDDKDITGLENDTHDELVVINFDEGAAAFGQVTLTYEEIEKIYLSIKSK